MVLKIVTKAGYECTLKKVTNESEGKPKKKCNVAFGKIKKLVSVFKEASKNFVYIFLLIKAGKNLRMYRKYLFVKAFKKYSPDEPSPLKWGIKGYAKVKSVTRK